MSPRKEAEALLKSYTFREILNHCDLTNIDVVQILIEQGLVDMETPLDFSED